MSKEKFTATKKYTASDIDKAIKANVPKKDRKKLPDIETAMTVGGIKRTIGGVLSNPVFNGVVTYLGLMSTAVKDGGKIKRKPASRSKIAKVMKRKKK
jgi:hypothetical protein